MCITSTWLRGGYNTISGTSMATPHVAGAAALFNAGNLNWNNADDPDGIKEPLLNVGGF